MRRCVIVGGAEIKDYALIREYLRDDDYFIYCDCGLNHKEFLRHEPDLIIGDFDSHEKPEDLNNVIILPVVKDDTDTIFAVKEGMTRGFNDFVLLGSTGGRIDHTLANIYALLMLKDSGKHAVILDDYSEMSIISAGESAGIKWGCKFFSLINISGLARGITIRGAKYNLTDGEIESKYQYGVSNEVLSPDNDAQVSLREGSLLLVIIRK